MNKLLIQGFAVNRSKINRVNEGGKSVIVLQDVLACRAGSVMNGLHYPSEFVANHFKELEGVLAPIGHPKRSNGELIPSTDVMAINEFHGGAWNKNARMNDLGEVYVDIHIDEKYAANSEKGKELLIRIEQVEKGETSHLWTSTGLYYESDGLAGMTANGVEFSGSIINGKFEHNAILLNELPAGGDTGFTVNNLAESHDMRKPKSKILSFFGLASNEMSHQEIDKHISSKLNKIYGENCYIYPSHIYDKYFVYHKDGKIYKRSYKIESSQAELGDPVEVSLSFEEIANNSEQEMNEEQVKNLIANAVTASEEKFTSQIESLKNENAELKQQIQANADAQLKDQREAVKSAFGLSDEAVSALAGNALSELYAKTQSAAPILGGNSAKPKEDEVFTDFNAMMDEAEGVK